MNVIEVKNLSKTFKVKVKDKGLKGSLKNVTSLQEAAVMESAQTYLVLTAISICPLAVYNACAALFRAMGDSKTTMWISILMNGLNVNALNNCCRRPRILDCRSREKPYHGL